MITQFSVRNYKSIRDEICLDMTATDSRKHEDTLIEGNGRKYLPVTAIYGANGGGKSNVIEALGLLVELVVGPSRQLVEGNAPYPENLKVSPYRLSCMNESQPTEFEILFILGECEYRYSIGFLSRYVVYECLFYRKVEDEEFKPVFRRETDDIEFEGEYRYFKVGPELADDMPLLTYLGLTYADDPIIGNAWKWFRDGITVTRTDHVNPTYLLSDTLDESGELKRMTLKLLNSLDVDIDDFFIEKNDSGVDEIFTVRSNGDYKVEFSFDEESSGIRRLFCLVPIFIKSLMNGETVVIDTLETSLHTLLVERLIMLFTTPSINRHGAQLIFTTYNVHIMNKAISRRDEIWFAAKGCFKNTELYSLAEFTPKPGVDDDIAKSYIQGRYGAIPCLSKY